VLRNWFTRPVTAGVLLRPSYRRLAEYRGEPGPFSGAW
jgi:hypothetical protein